MTLLFPPETPRAKGLSLHYGCQCLTGASRAHTERKHASYTSTSVYNVNAQCKYIKNKFHVQKYVHIADALCLNSCAYEYINGILDI